MSDLAERFEQAAADAQNLTDRPDNETLLKMYALYKQGTAGDVTGDKPGFFDFVGVSKYEAWEQLAGTAKDDAMQQYVELIAKLKG